MRVRWTDNVSNEDVLKRFRSERGIIFVITMTKINEQYLAYHNRRPDRGCPRLTYVEDVSHTRE